MFCPIDVDSGSPNPVQTYPLLNKPVATQRLFAHYSTNPLLRKDRLPTTQQTRRYAKTFWTYNIFILFLIQLSHYQPTLLFIISVISVFRFIIPQPSRDPLRIPC